MFTGLVEERGTLGRITPRGSGARLLVRSALAERQHEPFVMGESIAVDGVCLTVVAMSTEGFEVDASAETLARTTLGGAARVQGSPVNLERAMKLGGRMGGHMVTGHVDAVGALVSREPDSGAVKMVFSFPSQLAAFIAEKGSIAINGVSLTVNGVSADRFDVTVIPHTLTATSLGVLTAGSAVNLEVDLVARYVARMRDVSGEQAHGASAHQARGAEARSDEEWLARLARSGYV